MSAPAKPLPTPSGIADLKGREPIGAAVTIGVKGAKGFPIERDRFHVVEAAEDADGRRQHHRAFAYFNEQPPEKRRLLRGNLVHATRERCFEWHLRDQVGPNGAHPQRRPFCTGDGVRAVRWMGGDADNFKEIECPHERCEFRQDPGGGKPIPCKPWMRLVFRLDWDPATQAALAKVGRPALPSMTVKFTSGSWNTVRNAVGFFDQFTDTARELGIPDAKLFGLPFTMQLGERTNRERKSRFPVVTFTPSMDLIEFLAAQKRDLDALGAMPVHEALTDETQQAPDVVHADHRLIEGPAVPGNGGGR